MDSYFEHSKARVRPVARVQMSVLSPEEIVSVLVCMVGGNGGRTGSMYVALSPRRRLVTVSGGFAYCATGIR